MYAEKACSFRLRPKNQCGKGNPPAKQKWVRKTAQKKKSTAFLRKPNWPITCVEASKEPRGKQKTAVKVQILPDSLYGANDELALHKSLIIPRAFYQCPPSQYVLGDGVGVRLAILIRYFCTHCLQHIRCSSRADLPS